MSHIATLEVCINDLVAVENACKRLGWAFNTNKKTYKWYSRWVGDSPVPPKFLTAEEQKQFDALPTITEKSKFMGERLGKCDAGITVPGATYEMGLVQRGDEYILVYDAYGSGGLNKDQNHLFAQTYAAEKIKIEASAQGYLYTEQRRADGRVAIEVMA